MNPAEIFFLIFFLIHVSLPAMDKYEKQKYEIIHEKIFTTSVVAGYPTPLNSNGQYLISNCHDSKVLICFAGSFTDSSITDIPTVRAYNPLSLLDVKTGINKSFPVIKELSTTTPVSALHILDNNTYAVGHNKNIYLFQEIYDWIDKLNMFCKLKIQVPQTLSPKLSNDSADIIHTIDSSPSHLIVVSTQGHITIWPKKEKIIDTANPKTLHCEKPFFSSIFNKKENLLCLGLANGNLFITDIANLNKSYIINVFPKAILPIDYLNSYDNNIVACSFDLCSNKDTKNPFCCKKNSDYDPTCKGCKEENYKKVYEKKFTIDGTSLNSLVSDLKKQLIELDKQKCRHVIDILKKTPEICNYHKRKAAPFSVGNALLSAQQLKLILNNNSIIPNLPSIFNEELLTKSLNIYTKGAESNPKRSKQILRIQPIQNNQFLMHMMIDRHYKNSEKPYWTNEIYLLENITQTANYTRIFELVPEEHYDPEYHGDEFARLHAIHTKTNDIIILEEKEYQNIHCVIEKITQFIKKNNNTLFSSNTIPYIKRYFHQEYIFIIIKCLFLINLLFGLLSIIFKFIAQ